MALILGPAFDYVFIPKVACNKKQYSLRKRTEGKVFEVSIKAGNFMARDLNSGKVGRNFFSL